MTRFNSAIVVYNFYAIQPQFITTLWNVDLLIVLSHSSNKAAILFTKYRLKV